MQRMAVCLGLVCLVGLAGCGTPMVADDVLLARAETLLLGGQRGVVTLALSPNTLPTGASPSALFQSCRPGSVYLYQVGTDGKTINLVFPNGFDMQNTLISAGALAVPRSPWRLRALGQAGAGYMLAMVREEPQEMPILIGSARDGRVQVSRRHAAAMVALTERLSR